MKTRIKPIVSWSIWAGGLSLIMGIVTRHHLLAGFQSDETGMSVVIASVFAAGLIVSFLAAKQLHSEWGVLARIEATGSIPHSKAETDLAAVFSRMQEYKTKGETIDIHAMVDTYHSKHNSRVRSVSIMAALVISMGLLGTVVGLIMSISGLGGMVENIGLSRTTMMDALKTTVAGMGTAFYTTFFGALGGLILRAVAVSQLNSLSELCAEATEYADTHLAAKLESKEEELNQKVSQVISSFDHMQQEIVAITARLSESFESTMQRFGDALTEAGGHAMVATKECIGGMTDQMTAFGSEIGSSFGSFNESIEQAGTDVRESIGKVNTSIERSGDELHEAFGGLNHTIEEAGGGVVESFDALSVSVKESSDTVAGSLSDFKLSIDDTSLELQDAVSELHGVISQATGELKTLSKARLEAEATEIAGHLSLAAESIQRFLNNDADEKSQKVA
jgi:hypothetical protein